MLYESSPTVKKRSSGRKGKSSQKKPLIKPDPEGPEQRAFIKPDPEGPKKKALIKPDLEDKTFAKPDPPASKVIFSCRRKSIANLL